MLDDLVSWICRSGVKEGDELLTRYDPIKGTRKVAIIRDVGAAIKKAAALFGLPEKKLLL